MNLIDDLPDWFGPEQVEHLCVAFERSWQALQPKFVDRESPKAREFRDALARSIMKLAQDGETDPVELSNRALASLPSNAPYWTVTSH